MLSCSPDGDVAQLGERLICIQEVAGSIPAVSTDFAGEAVTAAFAVPGPWRVPKTRGGDH